MSVHDSTRRRTVLPTRTALSACAIVSALALFRLPGCTEPNPRYCDEHTDCAEGKYCDLSVHRCVPSDCGDGVKQPNEICDGPSLGGANCESAAGHLSGELGCNNDCTFDTSDCHTCGDGVAEATEQCDATDLNGESCDTATSFAHGSLACGNDCTIDTSGCHTCGNDNIEGPEECDGANLRSATCVSLGHTGGQLACSSTCQYDHDTCHDCPNARCQPQGGETIANCPDDCGWETVSAGYLHTCGLRRDGSVWCWGSNQSGALGNTDTHQDCAGWDCSPAPVPVMDLDDAVTLSVGSAHSCALREDSTVWCWGYNGQGQLGDGTTTDSTAPLHVQLPENGEIVAAGGLLSCALITGGATYCWGDWYGPAPAVVQNLWGMAELSAGGLHACAVDFSGDIWCWGENSRGQLGDGSTTDSWTPVQVQGLPNSVSVSGGAEHTCVRRTLGVSCWGRNTSGQLGDGTTTGRPSPVSVVGLSTVVFLSAGNSHTCAVESVGSGTFCWGRGHEGQLGDGLTTDSATPVQVSNLANVTSISAGNYHTCAVRSDGTAWCWGNNLVGQLGDGTFSDCATPVLVSDL